MTVDEQPAHHRDAKTSALPREARKWSQVAGLTAPAIVIRLACKFSSRPGVAIVFCYCEWAWGGGGSSSAGTWARLAGALRLARASGPADGDPARTCAGWQPRWDEPTGFWYGARS